MHITTIDVVGERIPFAEAFPVSYESDRDTEHAFVRLHTDTGIVGYGEGTALPWFTGETTESMVSVIERFIVPAIDGKSLDACEGAVRSFMDSFPHAPGATAAVEMALIDLRGKRAGISAGELLGHRVRETVPRTYILPGIEPEEAASKARTAANDGYRAFKVKATGNLEADAERINAVLDAIPREATLRVDPNTSWVNAPVAVEALSRINNVSRMEYLEQPTPPDRTDDLRAIWDRSGVPVYADEAVHGPADLERIGRQGTVAGSHLKLAKAGSLRTLVEMVRIADRHDLSLTVASAFGTSLDVAANLHIASTAGSLSRGCELCHDLIESDPVKESLEIGPSIEVPDGPGLGVELDDSLFE